MLIDSFYKQGSDGNVNICSRPAGTRVEYNNGDDFYIQEKDVFVVGWEAQPDFLSGYFESEYSSFEEASIAFDKQLEYYS